MLGQLTTWDDHRPRTGLRLPPYTIITQLVSKGGSRSNRFLGFYSKAFGDESRNFEPCSKDEDDNELVLRSPNFHITPKGLNIFNVPRPLLHVGSSAVQNFDTLSAYESLTSKQHVVMPLKTLPVEELMHVQSVMAQILHAGEMGCRLMYHPRLL
ncbi:hypothetical protein TNCV_3008731 [Trichonephila clavipes]|nr:hypothetical protein TNCV_3008731 [Trichonephila clavipes]